MKLALASARGPVHSNTHHHFLPPNSDCVLLGPAIEPEPEPELELAIATTGTVAAAFVAVHGSTNVYKTVATLDVEKITDARCLLRPPA